MATDFSDIEQRFRTNWQCYDPGRYEEFLDQVPSEQRCHLLVRLLEIELELRYQTSAMTQPTTLAIDDTSHRITSDDARAKACVPLFLLRFPELKQQRQLLIRLIVLEYALRLKHDRVAPNPESYLSYCSESQDQLVQLLELTEAKLHGTLAVRDTPYPVSASDTTVHERDSSHTSTPEPLPHNLGCFLLLGMLGRGGMGYVHAAVDLRSAAQVAVKVIRRVDAWSVYRFIEEFTWLTRLNHPNLVRLYDAYCEGDFRYYSMELVEGDNLRDWFRRHSMKAAGHWQLFNDIMRQLASAIHYLHSQGVIHRDVKCSNVMITKRCRAVLLDLGLATRVTTQASATCRLDGERLIGTLQYMPPEALFDRELSPASDWYSFGVLLYEVLANRYPPIEIAPDATDGSGRYHIDLVQIEQDLVHCPARLRRLCVQLLQPEANLRPSGEAILSVFGGRWRGDDKHEPCLVCQERRDDQDRLHAALEDAKSDAACLVTITGESGMGRTTFLDTWMRGLPPAEQIMLAAGCSGRDHTHLRLLNSLVHELVHQLVTLPPEIWYQLLKPRIGTIASHFPQLQQVFRESAAQDEEQASDVCAEIPLSDAIESLIQLFASLSQAYPLVIVVEDAMWADYDSLHALTQILSQHNDFRGLLILSLETDIRSPLPDWFQRLTKPTTKVDSLQIELQPLRRELAEGFIKQLAEQYHIDLDANDLASIAELSDGNPFLIKALLFGWYSKHAANQNEDLRGSNTLDFHRFVQLSSVDEKVLQFLAIANHPVHIHQLQMVARVRPRDLMRSLNSLEAQGWIRHADHAVESVYELANTGYRRLIVETLPSDRFRRRHYRWARTLSSEIPPPWPRVAEHYWHAEHYREASSSYLEATIDAIENGRFQDAMAFIEQALIGQPDRNPQEQRFARKLKAQCLAGNGCLTAAAELFEQLAVEAESDSEQYLYQVLAAECELRGGQPEPAVACVRQYASKHRPPWLAAIASSIQGSGNAESSHPHSANERDEHNSQRSHDQSLDLEIKRALVRMHAFLECFQRPSARRDYANRSISIGTRVHSHDPHAYLCQAMRFDLPEHMVRKHVWSWWRCLQQTRTESHSRSHRALFYLARVLLRQNFGNHNNTTALYEKSSRAFANSPLASGWERNLASWSHLDSCWFGNRLHQIRPLTADLRSRLAHSSDPLSVFWKNIGPPLLADLLDDRIDEAEQRVHTAERLRSTSHLPMLQAWLLISRSQIALYKEDWGTAREALIRVTTERGLAPVVKRKAAVRARILALSICCHLCQSRDSSSPRWFFRQAERQSQLLSKLTSPSFAWQGQAYQLVIASHQRLTFPDNAWTRAIEQLRRYGQPLLAELLQQRWLSVSNASQNLVVPGESQPSALAEQCLAPNHMMNMILPGRR